VQWVVGFAGLAAVFDLLEELCESAALMAAKLRCF
jgi:hypothetical protein